MQRTPLVSIIILNQNGGQVVIDCLVSVLKTRYPLFEVILLDNGSEEKERRKLLRLFGNKINWIFKKRNYGFAQANNLALRRAKGKYIVFLNNDTRVHPEWLKFLVETMESDKTIAFTQPKIIALENKKFFNYAGAAGGVIDFLGYPFALGRVFEYVEEDIGQYDKPKEIFWASGVAMMARKKLLGELGGFDPKFFACQEEIDLCFRAQRKGYKIMSVPRAIVYHIGSFTLNRDLARRVFLNHRNQLFVLFKNLRWNELVWVVPIRFALDIGAAIYYLCHRNVSLFFSVPHAHFSFFLNLPSIIKSRVKNNIGNFGFPQRDIVYRGSLIFDYFILRKKTYLQIVEKKVAEVSCRHINSLSEVLSNE